MVSIDSVSTLRRRREGKFGSAVRRTSTRGSCPGRVASLRRVPRPAFHAAAPTYTYCLSRRVQRLSALAFRSGGAPCFGLLLRRCPAHGVPPPLQAATKKNMSVVSPRPPRSACSGTAHAIMPSPPPRVGHCVRTAMAHFASRSVRAITPVSSRPHTLRGPHHGGTSVVGHRFADVRRSPRLAVRLARCATVKKMAFAGMMAWAVRLRRSGGGRGRWVSWNVD